jgi:altronate hydrolase
MPDIIDLDTGDIIRGKESIEEAGARLFDLIVRTASGDSLTKAERNGQEDFAPWRRCLSF